MIETLTVGVDTRIALDGLTDDSTGALVTTAVVTHTLRTADGVLVAGELARACPHVGGGRYEAVIPSTAALVSGSAYRGVYDVTVGASSAALRVEYIARAAALP